MSVLLHYTEKLSRLMLGSHIKGQKFEEYSTGYYPHKVPRDNVFVCSTELVGEF